METIGKVEGKRIVEPETRVAPASPPPPVVPAADVAAPEESAPRTALRAIKAKVDVLKRQFDAGSKSDIDAGGDALGAISAELQSVIDGLA